jgi:hypothetical protein
MFKIWAAARFENCGLNPDQTGRRFCFPSLAKTKEQHMSNNASPAQSPTIDTRSATLPVLAPVAGVTITPVGLRLSEELTDEVWCDLGVQLARLAGATQWLLGDWWRAGENRALCRIVAEQLGYKPTTLYNWGSVCGAFEISRRREVLSFSHHEAATGAPEDQRQHWLERAEEEKWSVLQLRVEIARAKPIEAPGKPDDNNNEPDDDKGADHCDPDQDDPLEQEPNESGHENDGEGDGGEGDNEDEDYEDEDEDNWLSSVAIRHRRKRRRQELEKLQRDPENREILCDLLRDEIEREFLLRVTGAELYKLIRSDRRREVFGDFIDCFSVEDFLHHVSTAFAGRLRKRLVEIDAKSRKPNTKESRETGVRP